jgi:putative redox protein
MIDQIERDIELVGDLDVDQRARLLEIADKCPVHRTLTSEIVIRSRLLSAASDTGRT